MAAMSAAMLRVLATSRSSTAPYNTHAGNASLMLTASLLPVTRPIRPHIDCTADIRG